MEIGGRERSRKQNEGGAPGSGSKGTGKQYHSAYGYTQAMSTSELLRQVKALPDDEREKFFLAVLTLEERSSCLSKRKIKRVIWPDVQARARRIFGKRILPNLVLLEREEATF